MEITIKSFAHLREYLGFSERRMRFNSPTPSVADAISALAGGDARIMRLCGCCMCAINRRYAARTHILRDGDELALIPPVAGG